MTAPALLRPGLRASGVAWMVLSIGLFTTSMIIVRGLADQVHVFEMVFFRALFGVAVMLPWLMRAGFGALRTRRLGLYAMRSALAATNLTMVFLAVVLMPVADVTAILFTRPFFTTILAIYLLGEVAGGRLWAALAVGFAGAMLIVQPGFGTLNLGAVLALGAALLTSVLYNIAKSLTRTETPDTIAFYQTFLMLPIAAVAAFFVWRTPTWMELLLMFAIGAFGTLSHRTMNRAYAVSELTLLQPLEFLRLPFAALLGYVLFGESPDAWVWIGGTVIFAATIHGTRRRPADKPEKAAA